MVCGACVWCVVSVWYVWCVEHVCGVCVWCMCGACVVHVWCMCGVCGVWCVVCAVFSLYCFHCVQFKLIWALRENISEAQRHEGVVYKVAETKATCWQ